MDPFTQRMLERARARQEKIDQKLANSGQSVPKRKPLTENIPVLKNDNSPIKSPVKNVEDLKDSVVSPRKSLKESNVKSPRRSFQKSDSHVSSPCKGMVVTKREFRSPRGSKGSTGRRNSDVSVEINIMHRDDIQIEVQVEERDAPMAVVYETNSDNRNNVKIKEIDDECSKQSEELKQIDMKEQVDNQLDKMNEKTERAQIRHNMKSRLDRLGNLYSDKPTLSSPIHRTEAQFSADTPPPADTPRPAPPRADGRRKFGRLAALADQINHWEDDLTHHNFHQEPTKKGATANKTEPKKEKLDSSTLDVSIHSFKDINKVLDSHTPKSNQCQKSSSSRTFTKPASSQQLDKKIVADLEGAGYRRVSAGQSRLVYDFTTTKTPDRARQEPTAATTPSSAAAPNMATMVANPPTVAKKPSIKKYKAPTPPRKLENECDSEKDKENNAVQDNRQDDVECKQTKQVEEAPASPVVKRIAPKLNGNVDRSSVLSRAAMFEAGSPKAKEKDPAEMSLRERKAFFEKNKGTVIMPKAPFGLAPSVKTLHGDNKAKSSSKPVTPTKPVLQKTESKVSSDDNISQSSLGGGIKEKLAALMNKEQTISEATIANKVLQEREKEMEMLQNRFHYKPQPGKAQAHANHNDDSDDDQSDHDPAEDAPLMGSTISLTQANKKPEISSSIPRVVDEEEKGKHEKDDKVVGTQPAKRRSSQDSPVVLSVVEDVKRIKVNNNKKDANGAVLAQPKSLYPHLSDIETDNSHTQEEYSDCGGSSSENIPDKLNKSENWADTSFGREVMNVVKKNRKSYKKAVRESYSDSDDCDSDLDACIDEALEETSEGPTPPKLNKHGLSSTSFVYQERAQAQFKSPQKPPPAPHTPLARDKGSELVHSVSFYRRMQNASSNPSTPLRIIRHQSPESDVPATDEPCVNVTTVRQRIKELQQEIAKQQTVISQASQALNLCAATIEFSGSTEQAEGERLLLLATHRRQACLHEVQRLEVEGAGPAAAHGMAALHIDSLRVPLRRDYMRQLNADGATGHHAVCLLKCRDRVLATSMQLTQPTTNILHFPDEIRMDGLTSDFKVTVEIYLLPASKEILPHNVKYHISNKKSSSKLLTPKSKVSELKTPKIQSPAGPSAVRSPQFQLHGYCIFALSQATRKTFTLSKVPCGSPLEGSVNIEIKARVRVPAPEPHAAFLTAFDDVSGLGAWHRRWFRLTPPRLQYWKYPDDVTKKMPIGDIDLSTVVSEKVVRAPRDLCARPNTLLMESSVPVGLIIPDTGSLVYVRRADGSVVRRHLLAADTARDRDVWLDCLNKALEYVRCCSQDHD